MNTSIKPYFSGVYYAQVVREKTNAPVKLEGNDLLTLENKLKEEDICFASPSNNGDQLIVFTNDDNGNHFSQMQAAEKNKAINSDEVEKKLAKQVSQDKTAQIVLGEKGLSFKEVQWINN